MGLYVLEGHMSLLTTPLSSLPLPLLCTGPLAGPAAPTFLPPGPVLTLFTRDARSWVSLRLVPHSGLPVTYLEKLL